MGIEGSNGGVDWWKILLPVIAGKKYFSKKLIGSFQKLPLLPATLALTSSLWQAPISKDHAVFIEDAKVILAEEIKSILREFGFIGEIAGPQERRNFIWYFWLIQLILFNHITGQQLQLL